jgi:hypothetical protein
VKGDSMTFFVRGLSINDTISFLDQGEFFRRVEGCRGNLIRNMRPSCFMLVRRVRLDFGMEGIF